MAKKKAKRKTGPKGPAKSKGPSRRNAAANPNSRTAQRARQAKKAKRDRFILIGGVAAVVAIVLGLAINSGSSEQIGVTDAAAFDLPALEGGEEEGGPRFQLADYAGTPLVVNFFASWCTSCESELPRFTAAADAFSGDLEIVFVNSNETGNWRPMAERTGIIDRQLIKDINGSNDNGLYRSLGGTGGMPLTAFYDREGDVVHVDLGELSTDALALRLEEFYGLSA